MLRKVVANFILKGPPNFRSPQSGRIEPRPLPHFPRGTISGPMKKASSETAKTAPSKARFLIRPYCRQIAVRFPIPFAHREITRDEYQPGLAMRRGMFPAIYLQIHSQCATSTCLHPEYQTPALKSRVEAYKKAPFQERGLLGQPNQAIRI